jgi:hypothetical protein
MHWFDKNGWRGHGTNELLGRPIGELAPMVLERRYRRVKERSKPFWSYRRNLRPTEPVHSGPHGRSLATEPHTGPSVD